MCAISREPRWFNPNGPVEVKQNPIKDMNFLPIINVFPNAQCIELDFFKDKDIMSHSTGYANSTSCIPHITYQLVILSNCSLKSTLLALTHPLHHLPPLHHQTLHLPPLLHQNWHRLPYLHHQSPQLLLHVYASSRLVPWNPPTSHIRTI